MHVDADSQKLKVGQKFFGVSMVKNGCGQSGHKTLKLTVSQKWTDGIKWVFACWSRFSWFKLIQWFFGGHGLNGHGLLVHETLKSAVS